MAEQISLSEQYDRVKAEYPDAILFFRLGDFYEMFNNDAIEVSRLLNLTLTQRQSAPMCGIPWHASRNYITRLLKAGRKIAICEQIGSPQKGKGLIERKVVEVISPGTVNDEDFLEAVLDNYLVAVAVLNKGAEEHVSLAWLSSSTGEFRAESFAAADREMLRRELCRLAPRELVVRESSLRHPVAGEILSEYTDVVINRLPDWSFSREHGLRVLKRHFGTLGSQGFGFAEDDPALAAAGALIEYASETCKLSLHHVLSLQTCDTGQFVAIDESTQRNLEIVRNLRDGGKAFSLLATVDATLTPMGARELRRRLLQPLRSLAAIERRLEMVDFFYHQPALLEKSRAALKQCLDLERLTARLAMDKATPKDLLAIKLTLEAALRFHQAYATALAAKTAAGACQADRPAFADGATLAVMQELRDLVAAAILDEPALTPADGPVIREGWHPPLDDLRRLKDSAQTVLTAYLEEERASSGLPGLRLKFNRVLGYHLELGKQAAKAVPSHFIRRQSVLSAERFSTERLASLESDIMSAADRIVEIEKTLFLTIRDRVKACASPLMQLAQAIADFDCHLSAAAVAMTRGYTRPGLSSEGILDIRGGRHPVVEAHLPSGDFIANDTSLSVDACSFALLTGPNMAGKSTFLRQNALIVLLAQAGCFVPADQAVIGLCDRIFCRVGAQDNLARGESTFLLEMHETASILNNASRHSLVIMDEVGRGTGTQDGLAIAWAVSEYMLNVLQCRTLFATHYHELTAMEHPRLLEISMAVEERSGEVVFLKRVVPGPAAGSYGIHVAGLAGVPPAVVARAADLRALLAVREAHHEIMTASKSAGDPSLVRDMGKRLAGNDGRGRVVAAPALFSADELVINALRSLDIDNLTPLQALQRLAAFKADLGR